MPRLAFRQAVSATLVNHLRAAFPELRSESIRSNPANPLQMNDPLPALDCFDGGQAQVDGEATPPEVTIRMEWDVEGWVSTEQHEDLYPALNDLHARVVEAMMPSEEIPLLTADGTVIGLWVIEGPMQPSVQGANSSEHPTASFLQSFLVDVTRNRGQAFVDLP